MTSATVRYLIVNGDDFGLSDGVSRGIVEAHRRGILTSTSLLVNRRAAAAAAALARAAPSLGVGLHLEFEPAVDPRAALAQQLDRFDRLMHTRPTHLDSHHDAHRDARVLPHVLECGERLGIPVRHYSTVACFGGFYGQWAGELHLEHIGVDSLLGMLRDIPPGITELICHPGYVDAELTSSYAAARQTEVQTLCDARVRAGLAAREFRLIGFRDLSAVLGGAAASEAGVTCRP